MKQRCRSGVQPSLRDEVEGTGEKARESSSLAADSGGGGSAGALIRQDMAKLARVGQMFLGAERHEQEAREFCRSGKVKPDQQHAA